MAARALTAAAAASPSKASPRCERRPSAASCCETALRRRAAVRVDVAVLPGARAASRCTDACGAVASPRTPALLLALLARSFRARRTYSSARRQPTEAMAATAAAAQAAVKCQVPVEPRPAVGPLLPRASDSPALHTRPPALREHQTKALTHSLEPWLSGLSGLSAPVWALSGRCLGAVWALSG